ncbi:MAG TPA: SMC-Scp complex subunit ScpB [Woeseiaceae bacterium]|nr:SMC-Scp complex subunit ScpB [Woeseiaceae bacterium]
MDENEIKYFVEAALLAAGRPLSIDQLQALFEANAQPEKSQIRRAIGELKNDYEQRGLEVAEVASGYRTQIKASMADRLQKLWEARPQRYSRALFETLALIAYRQPMTRGEIEDVRGVSVSPNIIRSLLERDWIRVVGHRDVPGRPTLFGTTRAFLDYFGLKRLDELPALADLSDWESLRVQLNLPAVSDEEEPTTETAEITELPVRHIEREDARNPEADAAGKRADAADAEPEAAAERADARNPEPEVAGERADARNAEPEVAGERADAKDAEPETAGERADAGDAEQDAAGEHDDRLVHAGTSATRY